jgi:predicted MFS family arabinose efflux permease
VIHPTLTTLLLAALPVLLLIGMTNSLVATSVRIVVQERTPRVALGRVFSVIQTASAVGFALGALLTGAAEGRVPQTFMVMGTALILIGLACSTWLRRAEQAPLVAAEAEGSV